MDIHIFCLDNTEFTEFDAINRGFRGDIYVKINEYYYNLSVYDILRLQQDFKLEIEEYGVFTPEPNLILVEEVNNKNIKEVVNHLIKCDYFNEIQPVSSKILTYLNLLKLEECYNNLLYKLSLYKLNSLIMSFPTKINNP